MEIQHVRELLQVEDADLTRSRFTNVNLADSSFENAALQRVSFTDVSFAGATFADADLSNVTIVDAKLAGMMINGILVSDLLAAYQAQRPAG